MKQLNFDETKKFYDFLRGENNVDIESLKNVHLTDYNISTEKSHLPKLTDEQAFLVIYVLQEIYGIIPDTYEQCSHCGELYDSEEEGKCYEEESYCDECYYELGIATVNELEAMFENASEKQLDELDFYAELLESGFTVDMVRKHIDDETADHMQKFCEEHGLLD